MTGTSSSRAIAFSARLMRATSSTRFSSSSAPSMSCR